MHRLMSIEWARWLKWPVLLGVLLASLSLVVAIYTAGQPLWAMLVLALVSLGCYVYLSRPAQALRYLFPGLAAMLVFVAFPLAYTAQIGFTNYSSNNLLSQERVTGYLLEQASADEADQRPAALATVELCTLGGGVAGYLFGARREPPSHDREARGGPSPAFGLSGLRW